MVYFVFCCSGPDIQYFVPVPLFGLKDNGKDKDAPVLLPDNAQVVPAGMF
jgi:hypothetical protein